MADKRHAYRAHDKMRDLIADNYLLLMAINRFDIPFGFGDQTIDAICAQNKVDVKTFLAVCNLLSGLNYAGDDLSLPALIGYLKRTHTSFISYSLPKIRHKLIEAINYSDTNDVAFQLMKFFDDYVAEVNRHMEYENDVIFSYAERLLSGSIDGQFSISNFSVNHGHMATKLQELKNIFVYHYKQKDNTALSSALIDIIVCEKDLMAHFEVESKLFVPAVEQKEHALRASMLDESRSENEGADVAEAQPDLLSEREKEIIICIAHGMANKEIADKLCLSIHTVATHRRNLSAKLSIHSAAGLTIYAILHHLVELQDVSPQQ